MMDRCIDWKDKGFSFFSNKKCEWFPCHSAVGIDADHFNCLFCFCPLYTHENCGGAPLYLKNGNKDCSACIYPHKKENYGQIVERLRCPVITEAEKNAV